MVEAVLAEQSDRPAAAVKAVRQLTAWVARPDWNTILPAYARCVRIVRFAQTTDDRPSTIQESLFTEPAERDLYDALRSSIPKDREQVVHPQRSGTGRPSPKGTLSSIDEFLSIISALIPAINTFFDKVLVMAEEKAVRENRLGLVQSIAALADGLADLSKLEGF